MLDNNDKKWLIDLFDTRFAEQDARIDERFKEQDARIDQRFAEQDARIDQRFAEQDPRIDQRFAEQAKAMQINGSDAVADAEIYKGLPEEQLLKLGRQFFLYFLHDDYNQKFRKMLTLEQFHDEDLAKIYSRIYVDDPLSYQGMLFGFMVTSGILKTDNVQIMTLHFYAPIYYLLTICDREPDREPEALKLLDDHIKQFDRIYGREN